jgi:peptidoglycan hydrolase CwlO-like protein
MMTKLFITYTLVTVVSFVFLVSCCKECQDDFSKTMEKQLVAFDAKIQALEAKAAELGEDVKAELNKAIEELKPLKEAAKSKLEALKGAGEDAWQDMKPALQEAMAELERTYEKTKSLFE